MKRASTLLLGAVLLSAPLFGQETRSTVVGRVVDTTGASIPNAQVTLKNTDTGSVLKVVTDASGDYRVPFLAPGPYTITVSRNGFKSYSQSGLNLQTEQTATENITLAVGASDQVVTVSADAPLVDTATSTTGQVLTAEEVEDLPANGRSPLGFAHLEYGAVSKGKHSQSQTTPFGNSTADDFALGGGNSASNELTLNGVPNMQDGSRTAGFSPQLDAVDAVRVDEFSASAAQGDTAGGVVNITTKAGTNVFHGSLSEYYAGSRPFTAKPYFTPAGTTVASTHFNQYGGTIGGPVRIPHVFNGKDKLFFFYAYEGYIGKAPNTLITSVPTQAERSGDFSALLAYNSANQLYNPYSGVQSTNSKGQTVISRSPIPGNILSNAGLQVSPVAAAYFAQIPLPNYNGASTKADGENNYFVADPTSNNYKSNMGRLDYNVSQANRLFVEAHRSHYVNSQNNYFNTLLSGTSSQQVLWGGQVDDVQTFSPTLSLEARLGFSRYTTASEPSSAGTNPSSVGMPGYIAANSTLQALPAMTFSDSATVSSLSGTPGNTEAFDDIQLFTSLNKTWGHHTLKIGEDIRTNKYSLLSPGAANGTFAFKNSANSFVTGGNQAAGAAVGAGPAQAFGGAMALFALGLPSSGSYAINTAFQYDNFYYAGFAQDDWKVLPNLTISMGLRLDHETPVVESNNNLTTGWNPSLTNIVTGPAAAAYAASPNAALPTSAFAATGGVTYATPSNRSPYHTAPLYVSPRVGFAYSPEFSHGKMAIRGGLGIYVNTFGDYNTGTSYGFSQSTNYIGSINNNLSPLTNLSDPFPATSNPLLQPTKSALGVNTQLGSSIAFYSPVKVPYSEKASLDIEQQFGHDLMVEVGYIFDHQVHNSYSNQISSTPILPYLSHLQGPDPTAQAFLTNTTTNPFYGLITTNPTVSLNTSKTISVQSLLQAYPQYSSVTESLIPGQSVNFNGLLFRVTKRMSQGLQFNLNYEHSRQLGNTVQLNAGGPLVYEETASDFPDHVSLTGIWLLPVGRGRQFFHNSRLVDEIFGGYSLTTIYQYLSGTPLSWGNVNYTGSFTGFANNPHYTKGPSFNTTGFATASSAQLNGYNYRTFPQFLLRSDPTKNFDFSLLKNFSVYDRLIVQPRFDAFNAFNRPQFSSPNLNPTSASFGVITSQLNTNRQLQLGVHLLF
ncbi:MAG: carboxypeptidase regulatory-like domain-containing protein [Acidobacteriota bacterium]|nr:carboxypeptidase regulatory-like domain-containing protein [Acidobacteriota bacterium]